MSSSFFTPAVYRTIEREVLGLINRHPDFLSKSTIGSTRAAGDAIQSIIEDNFEGILGRHGSRYSASFARRAMADFAFEDEAGNYYVVDVKTHREETAFNMPNLTSVDRLARFYEDDANRYAMLMVRYRVARGTRVALTKVHFLPIEHLKWSCLTIGALGWGQIQIANARHIEIDRSQNRRAWMLELCDNVLEFYPRETAKIARRITRFETVRQFWLAKIEN